MDSNTLTIDYITQEWKDDSKIDDLELDRESKEIPKLHAKYLQKLSKVSILLQQTKIEYNKKYKIKYYYYKNKWSDEDLEKFGLQRFDGPKAIDRPGLETYLNADDELCNLSKKIEYLKIVQSTLENILKEVSNRNWLIRNMIEWRKFQNGIN